MEEEVHLQKYAMSPPKKGWVFTGEKKITSQIDWEVEENSLLKWSFFPSPAISQLCSRVMRTKSLQLKDEILIEINYFYLTNDRNSSDSIDVSPTEGGDASNA